MIDYKGLVDDFQKGANVGQVQEFDPDGEMIEIKIRLLEEEFDELIIAMREGPKEEVRKELCDLLYIAFGIAATYGLPVDDDFIAVHQDNMRKLKYPIVNGKIIKPKEHGKLRLDVV